ncbi:hypothetical protein PP707_02385 [Acetobacter pasteurianus]|nr:hypothetical protein [Acetobacter pasteurianus]
MSKIILHKLNSILNFLNCLQNKKRRRRKEEKKKGRKKELIDVHAFRSLANKLRIDQLQIQT